MKLFSRPKRYFQPELLLHAGIYVAIVLLVSSAWSRPWLLLGGVLAGSALMLWRWHGRRDVIFYLAGFFLGPLCELAAVYFHAWSYARPLVLIPVWLPCLWGMAALFMNRLCDALVVLGSRK